MLINFQNIHNDYYLKSNHQRPQEKTSHFVGKSTVSSQVKQKTIKPDLLKVYFAGFKTHYDIKDYYLLDSKPVSIPEAVVKSCKFYSRPVGMVKVKNKSKNKIENSYIILGVNSGWNEIKILNAKGDTLGSSRFGEITTKVPDPKNNSLTEI